jgi:hypothetical protein
MAIPESGTFDYVARLGEPTEAGIFTSSASARDLVPETGDELSENRLVGLEPTLSIADAGPEPNPGPVRPFVLRSRLTFATKSRRRAMAQSASLYVDKALTNRLRPGDLVHVARSHNGGVGLSVIRDDELMVAIGAISLVPLGSRVTAGVPWDLVERAEAIFEERSSEFEFREWPLELRVGDRSVIQFEGNATLEPYDAFIVHGARSGLPGDSECAAIYRPDLFPYAVVHASAILLDDGVVEMTRF